VKRMTFALLLTSVLLAGCQFPNPAGAGGLNSWVDAPLHGSTHPHGPVELVAHGAAPDGVALVELLIGGNRVAIFPGNGQNLITVRRLWSPPGPGTYTFLARAQSSGGAWSAGSVVVFTVTGEPQPQEPGTTPSPSPTPSPTAGPITPNATDATDTPAPTTPSATPMPPTATGSGETTVTMTQNGFCRTGPGTNYPDVTAFETGTTLLVTGINSEMTWVQVAVPNSAARCWISLVSLQLNGSLDGVPILAAPPTITPSPTQPAGPTPSLTPTQTPSATPPTPPTPTPSATTFVDNKPPSVSIGINPAGPFEGDPVMYTATAGDNVGVVKIEIYIWSENNENGLAMTCFNDTVCEYEGGPYSEGIVEYEARAYDAAGNMASSGVKQFSVVPPP